MILASDFSGIGLAIYGSLLMLLLLGTASAWVFRVTTRFKRTWWLTIPVFSVLWFGLFLIGQPLYDVFQQWRQLPWGEERPFARAVVRHGGLFFLNEQGKITSVSFGLREPVLCDADLEQLVSHVKPGMLTQLTDLRLDRTGITDAGLQHLAKFRGIFTLGLSETAVTGAGFEHLAELPELAVLHLSKTKVTSNGLELLNRVKSLGGLYLDDSDVTDEGLKHLADHPHLDHVSLCRTKVTGAGLEHLKRSKTLRAVDLQETASVTDDDRVRLLIQNRELYEVDGMSRSSALDLADKQITDDLMKDLATWREKDWFRLSNTPITDEGLAHLKGHPVKTLFLDGTQVTDAGLQYLTGCPNLHMINLERTRVTDDGVAEFQKVLPDCRIQR